MKQNHFCSKKFRPCEHEIAYALGMNFSDCLCRTLDKKVVIDQGKVRLPTDLLLRITVMLLTRCNSESPFILLRHSVHDSHCCKFVQDQFEAPPVELEEKKEESL